MLCDKLTPIELECNMGKDINGVVHRDLSEQNERLFEIIKQEHPFNEDDK